jgi:phosphatidylglycerol:prolipoprotein diacylglycerol transferase
VWFGVPITSGQMLSLPMIVGGIALLVWSYKYRIMATPPTKVRAAS